MTGRPATACATCATVAPPWARTPIGPVCKVCYNRDHLPRRPCGRCGKVNKVARKATDTTPDICVICYPRVRPPVTCTVCGRIRPGNQRSKDGFTYCHTCAPRPDLPCAWCKQTGAARAHWPRGPVCDRCYNKVRNHPAECVSCRQNTVLIAENADGRPICGPCAGSDLDYRCRDCHQAGGLLIHKRCHRCTIKRRLTTLLTGPHRDIPDHLQPIYDALTSADEPVAVLCWLRKPAAAILANLVASGEPVTHQQLDELHDENSVRHLRGLLVHAGVLPQRDEHLERIPSWLDAILATRPAHHATLVAPFAHWSILRRARRRQPATGSSGAAAGFARSRILIALTFLDWLDEQQLTLQTLTQQHVDTWLVTGSTNRYNLSYFLKWTHQRGLTSALTIPKRPRGAPEEFLDDHEHAQQLRRCLSDATLPTDVRFAGAVTLLFGTRLSRVVELRAEDVKRNGENTYLQLDHKPVLLPPPLAALIASLAAAPRHLSPVERGSGRLSTYLLPGLHPGWHKDEHGLAAKIRKHGIATRAGRNTALLSLAADLPAPILAELVGLNPSTATQWARLAQRDWTDYLNERAKSIHQPNSAGAE